MVAVTTLPQSRPLTRADLDAMPDDGHRYEPIAWELRHSAYVEVAGVHGDEEYAARQPYPVTVRPGELRLD